MTTIAYRDGIVAADSRDECAGWTQPTVMNKLFVSEQYVYAATGDAALTESLIRKLIGGEEDVDTGEHSRVLRFGPEEIRVYEGKGYFELPVTEFCTFGCGMPPALGALHAGASAVEAVRIATLVEPNSGEPVYWCRVGSGEEAVRYRGELKQAA